MSSSSSKPPPESTQSAPPTARTTPNPPRQRNKQFQKVQIGQAGTSQSRQKPSSRSHGGTPNPHQSTTNHVRAPRDREVGSSGQTSQRQGGQRGKPTSKSMSTSQQQRKHLSLEELLDTAGGRDLKKTEPVTKDAVKHETIEEKNDEDKQVVEHIGDDPNDPQKEDDLVFETFYHKSGKEFQCIYQSGMRFYLDDWGSKEWQPFPKRWYNEGLLVTNTILKNDDALKKTEPVTKDAVKHETIEEKKDEDKQVVEHIGDDPNDPQKEDDLVFETFYHKSGKEFQCIYQSGMRFYLDDWGSKEWQLFPKRWYNEGLLVTNTILKNDNTTETRNDQAGGASGSGPGQSSGSRQRSQGSNNNTDDREGFIMHPARGRIPTYIFYKKHNVHMYFDKETGAWVRLPIGWELHHPMVKALVDQVEEAVPSRGDRHDIRSLLRACNYDPDECISICLHLERDEWMKVPRRSKEAKSQEIREHKIADLEKRVRDQETELQKERAAKEEALKENENLTLKVSELEVENKQTEDQLSAATCGRPKTAIPVSRMMVAGKIGKGGKGKEGDLVFETFCHRSGKEFQCIYQSGMRFYLDDWGSKDWQPFPKRWYNEGLLVTNTILKDDGATETRNDQAGGASGSGQGQSSGSRQGSQGSSSNSDDREGFIMHPTRGRIPTYIFYKKHNVHMYFDKETGAWVRLPIAWELHHPMVKALVDQVEEVIPSWGDRHDILSLLRACNYDPDECISIYRHLERDEWMKVPRRSKEAKSQEIREHKIADLEKRVRDQETELQKKERAAKEEALKENEDLTLKVSELEVENKQTEAQLSVEDQKNKKTHV